MSDSKENYGPYHIGTIADAWAVFISTRQVGNNGVKAFALQTEKKITKCEKDGKIAEWARQYETNATWRDWLMSNRFDCLIRRE